MANRRLHVEQLEDRAVPATFGLPWADPARVTLSFAPDTAAVAGRTSNLFESLNQDRSPNEWQLDVLRAFYAWTSISNIDIAVVPDTGAAFGTPGRLQGDPRFGDIRVGGNRLSADVLAVASPPDPALAGTFAGDVFVNTAYRFKDTPYDLYTVMLHEAGHALGLDHSTNPNSPMFPRFNNTKTALTGGDVKAIRTLYGPRQNDRFEGARGNGTFGTAAGIPVPTGYAGATPLLAFGDIKTTGDADVFWFDTIPNREDDEENVTVQLRTNGLSLLGARVTVYWLENGVPKEVANDKMDAADYAGDTLTLTFDGNDDDVGSTRRYFVRVEGATDAPFQTGRYALSVNFDGVGTVSPAGLEQVVLGPYRDATADALAALLRDPDAAVVSGEVGANDTPATASPLAPASSFNGSARYEALASLGGAADADVYRVTAPSAGGVLTATAWRLNGAAARVGVYDAAGVQLPAEVLVNDSGAYTVQATGLTPGAAYLVRVTGAGGSGNYLLTADFGAVATDVREFAAGELSTGETRTDTLYVGEGQLFHLALSADGPAGSSVTVVVTDKSGDVILMLTAGAGDTVSGPAVLLLPGTYTVRYTVTTAEGGTGPVGFRVRGNRLSDPIDPILEDLALAPEFRDPGNPNQFRYPLGVISIDPFYWFAGAF